MLDNARTLSEQGMFVSAETMLNQSTLPYLNKIHNEIVTEMKCQRHEVHPMYPSDFASQLNVLSLAEMKQAINYLLDIRHDDVWMLFGTFQFILVSMTKMINYFSTDYEMLKRNYAK